VLPQFACAKIQLENPETEPPAKLMIFWHETQFNGSVSQGQNLLIQGRGQMPVTLLFSDSYKGMAFPAGKNRASIVPIRRGHHNEPA
jgi:hypothetical protein